MNDTVERFKARRALYGKFTQSPIHPDVLETPPSAIDRAELLSSVALQLDDPRQLLYMDPDTLLCEIREGLKEKHFEALVDSCKRECLQAVIRPFGIARVLFNDKEGGNVTTTHNFKKGVTATEADSQRHAEWTERRGMKTNERRKPYLKDYAPKKKAEFESHAEIRDGYTGNVLEKNTMQVHWEHVVPVAEIDADAGRNLRMTVEKRVELANSSQNKTYTTAEINKRKNDKDLLKWYNSLTEDEKKSLGLDSKLISDAYKRAKRHIAVEDAKSWVKKDGKELIQAGIGEGAKMGLQQAFGALMEEFVLAAFAEVKDAWRNGFKARVDDGFLAALKERLMRVAARVLAKWQDALTTFKDGSISGFLSNLVTYIINMLFTTSVRLVRVIREGFMSLYRALKLLISPPEGMAFAEAADAATKLLAAGCVTGVGIMLEEWIEKSLLFLGPLAPYASTIVSALVTGLGTVFVTYMLERLDLFGVRAKSRHDEVMTKLNDMVCISYEKAMEDSAIFGEPALLRLT